MNQGLLALSIVTLVVLPFAACGNTQQSAAPSRDGGIASPPVNSGASSPPADAGTPLSSVDAALAPLPESGSVLQHHNSPMRAGAYVEPLLTRTAVGTMHLDTSFSAAFTGIVRAQPLYVVDGPQGLGAVYVTTESNDVFAYAVDTGSLIWHRSLGVPANIPNAPCGKNPYFYGIAGTPVIDPTTRTMYVVATLGNDADDGPDAGDLPIATQQIHAISIDDGSERAGWPVDPTGLESNGHTFDPTSENQRGALALDSGFLYIPYGSFGDCGAYQGWILAISTSDPTNISGFAVPGTSSGIWASGGVAVESGSLFVATGNSGDPVGAWAGGEAILRFPTGVPIPQSPADLYAPANWHTLDQGDVDLGVTGVTLIDMPASNPSALALALGKDGNAYLLDQNHLGGLGDGGPEGVAKVQVATINIGGAAAWFTSARGTVVVFDTQDTGVGLNCPPAGAGDLVALLLANGTPPTITTLWCAQNSGHGVPIVTTTDGTSDPVVWVTADTSSQLHAFDGETGATLFSGGDATDLVSGTNRFNTVIAVDNRILIGATNGLYAFTL